MGSNSDAGWEEFGLMAAEIGHHLGVNTSSIKRTIERIVLNVENEKHN